MKIFKFLLAAGCTFGASLTAEDTTGTTAPPAAEMTEDVPVNIAVLAESLDKIKFELNEILASREQERDHLEVFSL